LGSDLRPAGCTTDWSWGHAATELAMRSPAALAALHAEGVSIAGEPARRLCLAWPLSLRCCSRLRGVPREVRAIASQVDRLDAAALLHKSCELVVCLGVSGLCRSWKGPPPLCPASCSSCSKRARAGAARTAPARMRSSTSSSRCAWPSTRSSSVEASGRLSTPGTARRSGRGMLSCSPS